MNKSLAPSAILEIKNFTRNIHDFGQYFCGVELRPYQKEAAEAILQSVFARDGKTFILIFSRQSGKDEVLAIMMLYLMFRFMERGIEIVCAQPTFKPQTINAMERLMKRGQLFGKRLGRTAGYILRLGQARITYYSAEASASQVGATADRLLIMNEAQDIPLAIYDKRFSPMTASGNATKVFSGTSWTGKTLLAREKRAALEAEKKDGVKRVFQVNAEEVGKENSLYAKHILEEVARLGREHPFVRTQYFCEEIDSQAGMFPEGRMRLMFEERTMDDGPWTMGRETVPGEPVSSEETIDDAPQPPGCGMAHPHLEQAGTGVGSTPTARRPWRMGRETVPGEPVSGDKTIDDGRGTMVEEGPDGGFDTAKEHRLLNHQNTMTSGFGQTAFLIDVAGQDEARMKMEDDEPLKNPGRDSTRLSIVQVDTSTLATLQAPTYHVVERLCWTGENHLKVFGQIKVMAEKWKPMKIVLDATGVGEGLWTLFDKAYGDKVTAVKFSQVVKSDIGWQFLGIIETGRFRDHCATEEVREQYEACQSEILPGPGKVLRWGVPDGTRGANGEMLHDDIIMADALVAILDQMPWYAPMEFRFVTPLFDDRKMWEGGF